MRCPARIPSEISRLKSLNEYGLGPDTPLPSLDPIAKIAAQMFNVPVAGFNMIGDDRVFVVSSVGLGDYDPDRSISFCAHVITQDNVMVVPDASQDERFHDNPLVTGDTHLRFYAGVPLISPSGHALGALFLIDTEARRELSNDESQQLKELASMAADKLELRRLETAGKRGSMTFEHIAVASPNAIVCFDHFRRIRACNPAGYAMFGYAPGELIGQPVDQLMPERERGRFNACIDPVIAQGATMSGSVRAVMGVRRDGTEFPIEFAPSCWMEEGELVFGAVLLDISERVRHEAELDRLANYDHLTGLPNRHVLKRRLDAHIERRQACALVTLGLDGFKDVNDTLGRQAGDTILRLVADRLEKVVASDDLVARMDGDAFALFLPLIDDVFATRVLADRCQQVVAMPYAFDGREVQLTAGCGIALYPSHCEDADELISNADLALTQAKTEGRGRSSIFVPALRMAAVARRLYENELHRALANHEFELYYQPQIRFSDEKLVGAEALIRWRHPERGILAPAAFLPALETSAVAADVGDWVLNTACAQAAAWRKTDAPAFRIGVNLFAAQFRAGDLFLKTLQALERHQLPAHALELEITENIVLDREDLVLDTLRRIRKLGVGIAFDDFGTGYASLSLLKHFPITRIKIDQTFVKGMMDTAKDNAIIDAICALATGCGLEIIAEGVETRAHVAWLMRKPCDEGQGYHYGKPMPAEQFSHLFAESSQDASRPASQR